MGPRIACALVAMAVALSFEGAAAQDGLSTCRMACESGSEACDDALGECVAVACASPLACPGEGCVDSKRVCEGSGPCANFFCTPKELPGRITCANALCDVGTQCVDDSGQVECVPVSCDSRLACLSGEACVARPAQCVTAPCPQFECVPVSCKSPAACPASATCVPAETYCVSSEPCPAFTCVGGRDAPDETKEDELRPCSTVRCGTGTECDDISGSAECVPVTCDAEDACPKDEACEARTMACVRAPCPQFGCVGVEVEVDDLCATVLCREGAKCLKGECVFYQDNTVTCATVRCSAGYQCQEGTEGPECNLIGLRDEIAGNDGDGPGLITNSPNDSSRTGAGIGLSSALLILARRSFD